MAIFDTDELYFGGARSKPIEITPQISVVFRTLTTREQIDVLENTARFRDQDAKLFYRQIETLARAVVSINSDALRMTTIERDKFKEDRKRDPTAIEEASSMLLDHVPLHLTASMYEAYIMFRDGQFTEFEDIKKKLAETQSGP